MLKPNGRVRMLWLALLSASVLGGLGFLPVGAQNEGFVLTPETQLLRPRLSEYENELYGHTYDKQAVSQRVVRLEKTLFGTSQTGPVELRLQRIENQMKERASATVRADQEPMLAYLEQKLFQRTYDDQPLHERMRRLEIQVFGEPFDEYPISVRLKKLTYAMPIVAKEIRMSNREGMVIASTQRVSPRTGRTKMPEPEITLLEASTGSKVLPDGSTLSTGSYLQSVHKQANGSMLRWTSLPVRIYTRATNADEAEVSNRSIQSWQRAFSVTTVPTVGQAQVIVDWVQKPALPITRPITQMTDQQAVRTAIFINMAAFKTLPAHQQQHALTHQLGHAFGIWGHSDDPHDVMYPHLPQEGTDIPARWAQRSTYVLQRMRPGTLPVSLQPSQRDINTLLKVYDEPAHDLSMYHGY